MDAANGVVMDATLTEKKDLCYTPAGVAVFEARFHQFEAGAMRKVEFDFTAMAFAETAVRLNKLSAGQALSIKGFLSQRSIRSTKLTIHITEFKIRS